MPVIKQGKETSTHRIIIVDIATNKTKTVSLLEKELKLEEIHERIEQNIDKILRR